MLPGTNDQQLTEERRKEIFLALVNAQDQQLSVADSRRQIEGQFGVSESQVRQIEREGMQNQWPPLN
jgi:Mg2+/Co2+ transporter CorC